MTRQASHPAPGLADAGGQVAQLHRILFLVAELGGGSATPEGPALDQAARISAAYQNALPIDQRRFDAAAGETVRWATAGAEALLKVEESGLPCRAASRSLAGALAGALHTLSGIVNA